MAWTRDEMAARAARELRDGGILKGLFAYHGADAIWCLNPCNHI